MANTQAEYDKLQKDDKLHEYAKAGNEIAEQLGEDYISSMDGKEYRAFGRHQDVVMGFNIGQLASMIVSYEEGTPSQREAIASAAPKFAENIEDYKKELLEIIDICETGGIKYMFISHRLKKLLKEVNGCFGKIPQ